jgi:hypothetical protein
MQTAQCQSTLGFVKLHKYNICELCMCYGYYISKWSNIISVDWNLGKKYA